MNCRTATLICLVPLLAASLSAQPLTKPISVKTLVDSIEHALTKNYVFPAKAKAMADKLKDQYKKGTYSSWKDPSQIRQALENDLKSVHHDGHLHLNYDPVWAERLL